MTDAGYPQLADEDIESAPLAQAWTIPSRWYTEPSFHRLDRDAVFARTWQWVGDAAQVAAPGAFVTAMVADNPVLIVRDREGVLRAFYNVCRHRGGPLATAPAGCVKALTCQYHGWTYLLDGSLRGVPKWDRVELFDRKDYGLVPIRVETWEGLVFVNLDGSAPTVTESLDGIAGRIAPVRLAALRFAREAVYDVGCNWKVYVDNYLEGYHIPYVHPELMRLYEFQQYATEVHPTYSLQSTPLTEGDEVYGTRQGDRAFYFHVFPNFMLNILPGRLQTNFVTPAGPDRCRVLFRYYYDASVLDGLDARIAGDMEVSERIQQEDMEICEYVQRGLGSRAYDRGRFSVECEEAVFHFQEQLRDRYRRWRDGRTATS